ncbi:chitin deacetylase 7-like [Rhopilema esculentum]|uniref:chitin deacetylase 7-like n=1 Tax=Rhopilema esculentum TaxID=499914 RepID=UPI0031DC9C21|eukprot:gene7920-13809_t
MKVVHGIMLVVLQLMSILLVNRCHANEAEPCSDAKCKLPDCWCSGTAIPGGLDVKEVPQMVTISFDDSVNVGNFKYYQLLFNNGATSRRNHNGCNITATFFVRHEYTNYQMVQQLRHWRHEIADHTITHRTPTTWWKNASYDEWRNEIAGQQEVLRKFGNIDADSIKGFRAPYLQVGGNNQFRALYSSKFLYDCSMPTMQTEFWPYTLDYKTTQECTVKPCPTDSFPGLWEIPMTDYTDKTGTKCAMVDECTVNDDVTDIYDLLMTNFLSHYKKNRSPFPIFIHASWLSSHSFTTEALGKFLDAILQMKDVYIVTLSQVIQWMKNPTPLSEINKFEPWQCSTAPPPPACSVATSCEYTIPPWGEHVYLRSCESPCPKNYPWYGNPDGN